MGQNSWQEHISAELNGRPAEYLARVDESQLAQLHELLVSANTNQSKQLDEALNLALTTLPAFLRAAAKKVLFS